MHCATQVTTGGVVLVLVLRQRSEQNRTLSQSRSHFLRQANGRWHDAHIFEGRFSFLWAMSGKRPCG